MRKRICMLTIASTFIFTIPALSQTIGVVQLDSSPQIDGNADDWQKYQATDIPLTGEWNVKNVSVKCGVAGDEVFYLFQWQDSTNDFEHKPYIWSDAKGKYVSQDKNEDRFSINFGMEGDFTHDWISGNSFKADMWHWKAARSNPIGLAQDKMTIITTEKTRKAFQATSRDGKEMYISRPSDEGDKLYSTARYATKEKNVMPKYILNKDVKGSIADVKAKGVWANGQWTLELKRKLDTGHKDDKVFIPGDAVSAAIAVFDHTGDEKHNISETITFQF